MEQEYLYIAYSYDDPDNAAVLVSDESLTEIKLSLDIIGSGFIYRYTIAKGNALEEATFIEYYEVK